MRSRFDGVFMMPTRDPRADPESADGSQYECALRSRRRRDSLVVIIVSLAIAGMVVAPLVGGGRLFLLDWVIGPHSRLPRTAWGLDGGVTNGLPIVALVLGLNRILGPTVTWLPLFLFFPIAGSGIARLTRGRLQT